MPIIAALDFSSVSAATAQVALRWARRLGEPLVLAHVVSPPPALPHEAGTGLSVFAETIRDAGQARLQEARLALDARDVEVTTRVLFGRIDEALAELARELNAALLVLGSHGRGAAARLFLGSMAERLAQHPPCPTLIVPAAASVDAPAGPGRTRITAALGAGPEGAAVRDWLAGVRARQPVDVHFVHVYDAHAEHRRLGIEGPYEDVGDDPELLAVLRRELAAQASLPGQGEARLTIRSHWGAGPDPLAFEADSDDAELLVVGVPAGRGARAILPTLRAAVTPTLCVPAARPARAPETGAAAIPPLRRVLVATDFSAPANQAIRHAFRLVRAGGGRVELCHALDKAESALDPAEEADIKARLLALAPEEAARRGLRARAHVLTGADPATALCQAAERLDADVIVLASRGHGGLTRAVLGSVADAVVRQASRPVLVLGPRAGVETGG